MRFHGEQSQIDEEFAYAWTQRSAFGSLRARSEDGVGGSLRRSVPAHSRCGQATKTRLHRNGGTRWKSVGWHSLAWQTTSLDASIALPHFHHLSAESISAHHDASAGQNGLGDGEHTQLKSQIEKRPCSGLHRGESDQHGRREPRRKK